MCRLIILAVFLIAIIGCSGYNDPTPPYPLAGRWVVTEVFHDWTEKPEWIGVELLIEQQTTSGGSYTMINTKYDSIWPRSGKWSRSEFEGQLIFDDTLGVAFHLEHKHLIMEKWLPWTARPACMGGMCIPVVTGNWDFTFERVN